jgi:hypothetical protein
MANASLTDASAPPMQIWLHALHTCPAPLGPMWITRSGLAIAFSTGRTRSRAPASPPTITDSDALMAPISPPLTGASSIATPSNEAFEARSRATAGAIVLMSTMMLPSRTVSKTPFGPSTTSRTSGESGTMVIITSLEAATSAGDEAPVAPAATSASTGAWLRLCTVSENPFFSRLSAMGFPMSPSPTKPMRSIACSFSGIGEWGVGTGESTSQPLSPAPSQALHCSIPDSQSPASNPVHR